MVKLHVSGLAWQNSHAVILPMQQIFVFNPITSPSFLVTYFHQLLTFQTQLTRVPGYRQWLMCVKIFFVH